MDDKYCTYCAEAVTGNHYVHELRTYCCDSDDCQRQLREEFEAERAEREGDARRDDFDR